MGSMNLITMLFRWSILASMLLASAPLLLYVIDFWYKVFDISFKIPGIASLL